MRCPKAHVRDEGQSECAKFQVGGGRDSRTPTMEVVVSAPGKVLITGGYLILERPNAGLVVSTTARFYAIVRPLYNEIKPESWAWAWTDVKVTSPQLSRESTYKLSLKNSTLQCTSSRDFTNPFVEQAIQYAITASKVILVDESKKDKLQKLLLQGLDITILGANDFYSYRNQIEACGLPLTTDALASLPPFSSITFNSEAPNGVAAGEKCKPEVAKTGLGSSAAMTASVVAVLLHYLGVVSLPLSEKSLDHGIAAISDLDLVHIIGQSAHCIAQGKIGSGFDISAAVYGSQRYVRFSPAVLSSAQVTGEKHLLDVVTDILQAKWDHDKSQFSLPPLMTLLLGEPGSGGSSTPSMVGSVKQWQKSDPQKSQETWKRIASANSMLEEQLKKLSKLAADYWDAYSHIISRCSLHAHGMWMQLVNDQYQELVVKSLLGARNAFLEIRLHMREMGKAAGVPIEPESQTRLLDATMNSDGVLLAGVPGAEDPRGVSLESGGDPRVKQVSTAVSGWRLV
ncbi:hypothetical protein OPV22_030671 [Ensete ventricosum]|uniref:phosphomevalonate kinase n=1 Tax=Ensete ventricosum TaxID=4639 RepID=A0AAV8Q9G4_ENSVE|nr:hypothetical protein OPV22_030671 [Ensete ventricosum]